MSEEWHERDGYICCCAEPNPPSNGTEDGVIGVEQEHKKAGKEEEE